VSAGVDGARGLRTARESSWRWLLVIASSATVFSILHNVEHVARGNHSANELWPILHNTVPRPS
jgi:hypothetical protein